jgi:hypothetical protein
MLSSYLGVLQRPIGEGDQELEKSLVQEELT